MPTMITLIRRAILCLLCCALPVAAQDTASAPDKSRLPLEKIKLPPGFAISLWAQVPNAREMALGKNGTVFVGSMTEGKVYAVTEAGGARQVRIIARGLNLPAGVAFRDGALYVSAVSRILRFDDIEHKLDHPGEPAVVTAALPEEKHHGWKFIAFGPDGLLYVPQGAPCNICEADPMKFALIARVKPDGSGYEVYAQGVRNSVGFDWHPVTKELWFTDNGRDWMGDDLPPDELNHAPRKGMNFGYPYCHGSDIPDPKLGAKRACGKSTPPAIELDAHVAPLGMRFYTGKMFPTEYHAQIFIAEHGSWNRRAKIGYRLELVRVAGGKAVKREIFAEGWLQGQNAWGRPADVLVMPDGALLVSDDLAGAIYRISYQKP